MEFGTKHFALFLVFNLFAITIRGQNDQDIDLDFIHNNWVFSISESSENVLVYRDEANTIFDSTPYDSDSNLRFTRYDDTFYLQYLVGRTPVRRCGNGPRSNVQTARWAKGVWSLEKDEIDTFLVLEHFEKVKGDKYRSTKKLEYHFLHLTDEIMVLQKSSEESIN